jgi:hypothetical protein
MHLTGFEPEILASERPQNHNLDRAASGVGCTSAYSVNLRKCLYTL